MGTCNRIRDSEVMTKRKFLVWDTSIGLDHALRLAEEGHTVYYYVDQAEEYARFEDFVQGDGFNNIIKVLDWGEGLLQGAECVVFTDVGRGSAADYLRSQGVPVFGPSQDGETLEQDRSAAHVLTEELGIEMPPYVAVAGFSGLLDWFGENLKKDGRAGYFVKVPIFRGNAETMYIKKIEEIDIILRGKNLAAMLGPYSENFEFLIEQEVKGVEIGVDTFFNGTKFLDNTFFTFEVSSDLTLGKWVKTSPWDDTLQKLAPYLAATSYRGPISLEAIWSGDTLYVLDFTCRFPYPGSAVFSRLLPNYGDLIWAVANGEDYEIKPKAPYAACIGVYSDRTEDDWGLLTINSGAGKVYLRSVVKWKDQYYVAPGDKLVAAATAEGHAWRDVLEDLKIHHKKINVTEILAIDSSGFIEMEKDYIKPARKRGFKF